MNELISFVTLPVATLLPRGASAAGLGSAGIAELVNSIEGCA
mgnify:FL=1